MSKYCIQCGNTLEEGEEFCSNCGQKVNNSKPTYNNAPPPLSNNNNYKEEPYKDPSFDNTYYNESPQNINSSTYNKNVLQAETSSKTKLAIIISIVTTVIVLSICGYLYLKWKNNKDKISSKSPTLTNNASNNSNNNTNSNSGNTNTNKNNNSSTATSNNNENNSSSNNLLSDDMIKEYIALADSTCLNLFKLASEAEQNNKTKQPFASIRPLLQNCYSDALVDGKLKPFYESHLGEWTYELGMAFPFHTKTYFEDCSFTVIKRTDSIVQVKIIDNNPQPLIESIYTLKKHDKIWKIESIEPIIND